MEERRRYPRLTLPLEGSFLGRSGGSPCRISDISWGGCFVQTVARSSIGQRTIVTVPTAGGTVAVSGTVLYVEPSMGFAVKFDRLSTEQVESLSEILGEAPPELKKDRQTAVSRR